MRNAVYFIQIEKTKQILYLTYIFYQIFQIEFVYLRFKLNMLLSIRDVLILMVVLTVAESFIQIIPQFNASNIGPNTIIHDAVMINSSKNLIISYNQNGVQYISKYSVQAGNLVLQTRFSTATYNPGLSSQPITLLCVDNIQSQIMAFTGINYQLYLININTLGLISSSSSSYNLSQMIWSSVNNNIYVVCKNGIFGYLNSTNNWMLNNIYVFSPASLRMSVSPNFKYMAVSSVLLQAVYVFNIITNKIKTTLYSGETNTVAHEWYNYDILRYMPPTAGILYEYTVSSSWLDMFTCFSAGIQNVFSVHRHQINNSTDQLIIGSRSGQTIKFMQYDLTLLSVIRSQIFTYSENLILIKYSTSSEKALLIFTTFIDSIDILMQCQTGYVFDTSLDKCILIAINSANSTNSINSTNSTNSTNSISFINATNSTNYTNYTNIIYSNTHIQRITYLSIQQLQFLMMLIQLMIQNPVMKSCNYVPGNRRTLQPIFIFFTNFDDIMLYIYHQRRYSLALNSLFSKIQTLQDQRWKTIKFEELWNFVGFNTTFVKENFDTKLNYSSWKFIQIQGYSSGFIINTLNFFFSNLQLIFFIFLILRTIFFLLFKYKINSFWPYLYFMIIDGNLQFLSYMYVCELQHFFTPNFSNKCGLIFMICIFLVLILLISCSHLILKQTYGALAKYFFEDTKSSSIQASIYLILQFGYRNFLLGAFHALFNQNYLLKISLLVSVQTCSLFNNIFFLKKRNFFRNQTRITVNIIAALLRIFMIFTFIINTQEQQIDQEMSSLSIILQRVHFMIVISCLFIGIFGTVLQMSKMIHELVRFIRNKQNNQNQQQFFKIENNRTIKFISKQEELQNQCKILQFEDKPKIVYKKIETKKRVIRRYMLKNLINQNLNIKQIKPFQTNKEQELQHVQFQFKKKI